MYKMFEEKRMIIGSKQFNKMKAQQYGKWYLQPADFNKKVKKISKKVEELNKTIDL